MTAVLHRSSAARVVGPATTLAAAVVAGAMVSQPSLLRVALGAAGAFLLAMAALRLPARSVLAVLVTWMAALGLVRRLTSGVSPKEAWGDPLLFVGATVLVVLALTAVHRGALRERTRLSTAVLVLGGLLAASALNPQQGGLTVGLSGALLVVVPMLAFLVGRALIDDDAFSSVLWLLGWLGMAAALYGLYQTFVGFPAWDAAWIESDGYTALNVNGVIRAFASFSAASEYLGFLELAVVAWVARARGLRWGVTAAALAVIAMAIWYGGARGPVVSSIAAVGVLLAAKAGQPMHRCAAFAIALLLALPPVVSAIAPATFSSDPGDRIASRQVSGLTDPFGDDSTLPDHISMVQNGLGSALENPIGRGVGATTISAGKYGGSSAGTEADPGNVPVAAGLPGLVAYASVVVLAFPASYRLARQRRDPTSLAALGILVVTFMGWLNGGHYAVTFWPWLVAGWVDQTQRRTLAVSASAQQQPLDEKEGVRGGGTTRV